jgi:hypothetical protein
MPVMEEEMDRLSEEYWDLQGADPPVGLEEFLDRAVAGEYGPVTREELRVFLAAVEERLVAGIERGEGSAHDATDRDDLVEETRAWIDDLTGKFCED